MKNIDKIRAMSAEELAEKVFQMNGCVFCAYNDGKCLQKDCTTGQVEWLNQEVNPKPKLQIGDILEVRYGFNEYIGVYTDDVVVIPNPKKSLCITDEDVEILAVWRISVTEGYKRIWRADNG